MGTLRNLGQAVDDGDVVAAADCWRAPALSVTGPVSQLFASRADVVRAMRGVHDNHRLHRVRTEAPLLTETQELAPGLVEVVVEWPSARDGASAAPAQRTCYILEELAGQWGIRFACALPGETG